MRGLSMGSMLGMALIGAALLSAAAGAGAGPIANQVQNGGFEEYDAIGGNVIPHWSVSGTTTNSGISDFPVWQGLGAYLAGNNNVDLAQTITVVPNEEYTFSIRHNFVPQTEESISTTVSVWFNDIEHQINITNDAFLGPGDEELVYQTFWGVSNILYTPTLPDVDLKIVFGITPIPTSPWFITVDDVQLIGPTPGVPEIDATAYAAALVLVAGAMALRSHRA